MGLLPLTEFPYDGLILYNRFHHAHSLPGQDADEILEDLVCGGGLIADELFAVFNDESEGSDESHAVDGSERTVESAGSKQFMKPLKLSRAARVREEIKVREEMKVIQALKARGVLELIHTLNS